MRRGGVREVILAASPSAEMLTYMHGQAAVPPLPEDTLTDAALVSVADLLRRYHRAVASFDPAAYRWPRPIPATRLLPPRPSVPARPAVRLRRLHLPRRVRIARAAVLGVSATLVLLLSPAVAVPSEGLFTLANPNASALMTATLQPPTNVETPSSCLMCLRSLPRAFLGLLGTRPAATRYSY